MDRYICIHSHFYQPPREHPWLEEIEGQDSAYPYHDWNERITAECYRPNTHSRILEQKGRVAQIVNNYAKINFNFGPTLLSWMEEFAPDVYKSILDADVESQKNFSGHGSAIAQVYNHIIMPLATRADKETQIIWGIKDFEHRFKRKPEGMWLAETAVDVESLELLAEQGIAYTILAPRQAHKIRPLQNGRDWQDVSGEQIDPSRAYLAKLPSGKSISLFFYDGPISRAIAFEQLLENGESFAGRLATAFNDKRNWSQLVHVATDGETYGHHHKHGDMALAYTIHAIEAKHLAKVTVYGEYLEKHPPEFEVEIFENSSWSCVHGIERWRSDCGCNSGGSAGWNQKWRAPFRAALDWLHTEVNQRFEQSAPNFLRDPRAARNDYVTVLLDRSEASIQKFLDQHASRALSSDEIIAVIKLFELQRHALYMYTSCGWFFDELSGIETVQNLQYAGRVVALAQEIWKIDLEPEFLNRLEHALSNIPAHANGKIIYEKFVKPAMVDLLRVGAHYAVSSLFEAYEQDTKIFCYKVHLEDTKNYGTGNLKLSIGHGTVHSLVTLENIHFSFGILYFGDHNLHAGVRYYGGDSEYQKMLIEASSSFLHADFPAVIRILDRHFGASTFSLKSLFGDEQRKILKEVLKTTLATVEHTYTNIYKTHYPLILYLTDIHNPLIRAFQPILEFMKNREMEEALSREVVDRVAIDKIIQESDVWNVRLDSPRLSRSLQLYLEEKMLQLKDDVHNEDLIRNLREATALASKPPFAVELWKVQDIYYDILQKEYERSIKGQPDKAGSEWAEEFKNLGGGLSIEVPG